MAEDMDYIKREGINIYVPGEKSRESKALIPNRRQEYKTPAFIRGIPVGIIMLALASRTVFADSGISPFALRRGSENTSFLLPPTDVERVTIPSPSAEFDFVYPKLNDEERLKVSGDFYRAKEDMQALIGHQQYEDIKIFEPAILEAAKEANMPGSLLEGLVAAESLGNQFAVSGVGAKGLTQMMDLLATSEKYGFAISDGADDERLTNPEKLLKASASELRESYERFGDWGMALWAWHIGVGEVYTAVQTYGRIEYGIALEDVIVVPMSDSQDALDEATIKAGNIQDQYRDFISSKGVNLGRLFSNETVRAKYVGEAWDRTMEYVPRIIASSAVIAEMDSMEKAGEGFED